MWWWIRRVHPHPVLCGPRGILRLLPDHMHEGECYEPTDLTASLTFDGHTTEEYPAASGGGPRVRPEVIAWATVTGGRGGGDFGGPVNAKSFGVIGAYDGHRAGVGRVLVDATWHHFFNVNLVGDMGSADPIKSQGFYATPAGRAAYADICAYFRNIAVWLARPASHDCMRWRALWMLRWHHQLMIELRPDYIREGIARIELSEFLRVGVAARDVLGRLASQCQTRLWVIELVRAVRPDLLRALERYTDPWKPLPPEPDPEPDPVPWLFAETFADALLGATLYALAERFPRADAEAKKRAEKWNPKWVVAAFDASADRVIEAMQRSSESLGHFTTNLASGDARGS
jgi:hypothetical protein